MSFLAELKGFKKEELASAVTIVTKPSGEKYREVAGNEVVDDSLIIDADEKIDGFFVIDADPDEGLHEVVDGVFIGSQDAAANYEGLQKHSVTHILNAAKYISNFFPDEFVYKCEPIYDEPAFDISPYLESSADFIKEALDGGGKVLCHCNAGIARSSTLILAYLMKWCNMSLDEGLELIRVVRPFAKPNVGFMLKLRNYEEKLSGRVNIFADK